uniref:Uncharacterized protein AlNc14C251G9644 n=1 Tax=Albugo laibachii Nc14 TaxID=890382 RepID=F0WTG5_9STRA|nr:conserved hypothetical protein [Albugo laibachii Nc14]|eukprot:CCA24655.1 conserved hypothetical protein [Albugo laibachii Nc14]
MVHTNRFIMNSESLLSKLALFGAGFFFGGVQCGTILLQLLHEIVLISTYRRIAMALVFIALILLYIFVILVPLNAIAKKDSTINSSAHATTSSFRREVRRRGSFSMNYVLDIKAHVFSQTKGSEF